MAIETILPTSHTPAEDRPAEIRWPIVLWIGQLAVVLPIVGTATIRLASGVPVGRPVWLIWILSAAWTVTVLVVVSSARARPWLIANRWQLVLSAGTTVVALGVVGELGVRRLGSRDEDGNFYIRGHHLRPYQLPVKRIESAVAAYRRAKVTVIVDDPGAGWIPRSGSSNDLYAYNGAGIRTDSPARLYAQRPESGIIRISLFGDSFTNGVDVPFEGTWGFGLENLLNGTGRRVEILNFGVPGYGMDQAFLRWTHLGPAYAPQVVIFGLQIENVKRNVNIIRPLYNHVADLPFSKPRFVADRNVLATVNVPALSPEQLVPTLKEIQHWKLATHEAYYDPADYGMRPWQASRFISFAEEVLLRSSSDRDRATPAEGELALQILRAFEKSVSSSGARFIVVHLPRRGDLKARRTTGALPNSELLQQVTAGFEFAETADALLGRAKKVGLDALFTASGHYSPIANALVSEVLAAKLGVNGSQAWLAPGSP